MEINVTIDGKNYKARQGQTVLDLCKENNIFIPTFCNDERLEPYTSCFICIVEIDKDRGKFSPSCSTTVLDGMNIKTDTQDIRKSRKMNLELLLSNHIGDCYAPCTLECPGTVDIPGYISLINRGKYREAVRLIRQENPLALVCGRVCARPCEDVCRRNNVDSEIAIDWLKRFATDFERKNGGPIRENRKKTTGKKVAIIGAGPAGLSCAYYLSLEGHSPIIFETLPEAGGMLRYGIPAYRMPRNLLKSEIEYLLSYGSELRCNQTLGKDFTIDELKKKYDAVFLGVGAQNGSSARSENEELALQGVDFLREQNLGKKFDFAGKVVVVLGGGNTTIDCARTALRLEAKSVIIAYRRKKKQMPANDIEIHDAIEEGVIIKELCAPSKFNEKHGKLTSITLDMMKLGIPDSSGRARPQKTGKQEELLCDIAIAAIGQKVAPLGLEKIETQSWGTIKYQTSFETSTKGVFTGGDAARGPDIAISAIADGKLASESICQYMAGKKLTPKFKEDRLGFMIKKTDVLSKKQLKEYLSDREKIEKSTMPMLEPKERIKSWDEVEKGLDLASALHESRRCLECGCQDVFECKLKKYANDYSAELEKFKGEVEINKIDNSHPFLEHDPSKCILCGSCIRICTEVEGVSALGFVNRGIKSIVQTDFNDGFSLSRCNSCGSCIAVCPVGALTEKDPRFHQGPLVSVQRPSNCLSCGDMCDINLEQNNGETIKITSSLENKNRGLLCSKGKFDFATKRLLKPLQNGQNITIEQACKGINAIVQKGGSLGIIVGSTLSCDYFKLIDKIAKKSNSSVINLPICENFEKFEMR